MTWKILKLCLSVLLLKFTAEIICYLILRFAIVIVLSILTGSSAFSDQMSNIVGLISCIVATILSIIWADRKLKMIKIGSLKLLPTTSFCQSISIFLICLMGVLSITIFDDMGLFPNIVEETIDKTENDMWGVLHLTVAAPFFEEILHRGVILGYVLSQKKAPAIAIIISALLFGIMHINPAQIVSATLGGIFLGVTFWKTSSLFLPIVIHVLNNSFCVLRDHYFTNFSFVDMVGGRSYAPIIIVLTYCVCLIGLWKLPIRHQ